MSQQNMAEQNLPNGILPQIANLKRNALPQDLPQHQFNGVLHSSHSSRDSSPSARQIPSSQLPPVRPIPTSQLPPSRSPITTVTQKMGQLSVSNQITPSASPKIFNTSTPNELNVQSNLGQSNLYSPITSQVPKTIPSQLTSVPLVNNNLIGNGQREQVEGINKLQQEAKPLNPVPQQFGRNMGQPGVNSGFPQGPIQNPSQNYNGMPMQNPNLRNLPPQQPANPPINQGPPLPMQNQFKPHNSAPNLQIYNTAPVQQSNQAIPPNNQYKSNLHSHRYPNPQQPTNFPPQQPNYSPQQPVVQNQQINFQNNPQPTYPNQQLNFQNQQSQSQPQPQYQFQQNASNTNQQQAVYPQQQPYQQKQQQQQQIYQNQQQYPSVAQTGFSKFWGSEKYDLLQNPNILPPTKIEPPRIQLGQQQLNEANCSPEIMCCTMTKIPESSSLLQKSRLPLGVLIHPFKDLGNLPVIQCNVIVRCRSCRTYINPFVYFVDTKRWKCNLCYRINELPEEFQYDPVSKTYGDPSRRPEIKASTIEYIAPAEYMLRPPQPAVYLFLLDISRLAIESGYLEAVCSILLESLPNLPGDARTQIGFLAYDSALHFFSLAEGLSQPHEMTVLDIEDIFLPTPDNLLVNLKDRMELIADLLTQLPERYVNSFDSNSALGAALQAAYKMMGATGGRVTVFQAALPNVGPGALTSREDPSQRAAAEVAHLNPANDFYKRLALECSGQQIAVDLFIVNSQYVDIATISGISRFSGGSIHHFPLFKVSRKLQCKNFKRCFQRYLMRKIGFEAVMRIRCTRGLSVHTFHGNFFVRSTDLLSLPNINPDAGFGMQVAIDESLSDVQTVCFQAALLYTSSKGERRIRVHTMCLPIASTLHDIINSADQQCIVGLLSKMAVDRSMQSSLADAREAFINVAIDILSSYKLSLNLGSGVSGLLAPNCLRVLPLYISALLKHAAFRTGTSTRLDDRLKAMIDMKTKPLYQLIQLIYPDLYPIHNLENQEVILNTEEEPIPMPPRLQLTARCLDSKGAFLLDMGDSMAMLVCPSVSQNFLNDVLGVGSYAAISDDMYKLPVLNNPANQRLHVFINYLNADKPYAATLQIIRDNSPNKVVVYEKFIEDRYENALSYHEFLQHLKTQVK